MEERVAPVTSSASVPLNELSDAVIVVESPPPIPCASPNVPIVAAAVLEEVQAAEFVMLRLLPSL